MIKKEALRRAVHTVGARLLPVLNFANEVAPKIPTAEDTWLQVVVKALAVGNTAYSLYAKGAGRVQKTFAAYEPEKRRSELFVNLFFNSEMSSSYRMKVHEVDACLSMIEAVGEDGERAFFQRYSFSNGISYEAEFYTGSGFDMAAAAATFWRHYRAGVYLAVVREPGSYCNDYVICEIPPVTPDRLSKAAREQLERLSERHSAYVRAGVHRSYLCLGPPGTGKTTFAALFGARFGGRTLKFDAASLAKVSVKDLSYLLEILNPNLLVLEDMDRADNAEASPRTLFLMERLKAFHPTVAVLITVNDPAKLDPALLRSGRIDVPLVFGNPGPDEVRQLVGALAEVYSLDPAVVPAVVAAVTTDELSQAYVADLCQRLRYEHVDDVLESVRLLRKLSKASEKKPPEAAPEKSPYRAGD